MASIPESILWQTGIIQFETTDPIQGGINGIDNLPHTHLANRTLFLKARQDAVGIQVSLATSDSDTQQFVSAVVLHVPTLAALRGVPIPQISAVRTCLVIVRGGAVDGDGNGGTYRWSSTATGADDNLTLLTPSSIPATGRWLLVPTNPNAINASKLNNQAGSFYQNASNLNAGSVPSPQLGSGTADVTTYLRGDRVWSAVNAVSLNGQSAAFYQNAANLNTGVVAPARLGGGSPTSTNYLRGDGTWSTVDAATFNGQSAAYYLNVSNFNAGTVPTVRMGSGTANGSTYLRGDNVWSPVDAINLNGQAASFYTNASNLNSGTIPDARVAQSAVTQHQAALTTRNISGKAGTAKFLNNGSGPPSLGGSTDGDLFYFW